MLSSSAGIVADDSGVTLVVGLVRVVARSRSQTLTLVGLCICAQSLDVVFVLQVVRLRGTSHGCGPNGQCIDEFPLFCHSA